MTAKEKLGLVNLIIILIAFSFIFYSCTTKKSKPQGIRDAEYMAICQKMIERRVNYPKTLDHAILSTNVYRASNGNITVTAPFSAKNAFGVEIGAKARCVFTPSGENEITIIQD
ncbi:hypothetical protein [Acinetobacter sp. 272263]|uniref:hypothetical protein n=1 Tax=Acinetobacter sp. 272263 TaxID=1310639 RepID=UPI00068B76EB|nr:hypothetical protein [Acinetobacter sp. 272263]